MGTEHDILLSRRGPMQYGTDRANHEHYQRTLRLKKSRSSPVSCCTTWRASLPPFLTSSRMMLPTSNRPCWDVDVVGYGTTWLD